MTRTAANNASGSRRPRSRIARAVIPKCLLGLVLALLTAPAFAQGCAMCYATAKATPKDGQRAINRGILVMVFPPLAALTLGVGAAFRYGKKRDSEKD